MPRLLPQAARGRTDAVERERNASAAGRSTTRWSPEALEAREQAREEERRRLARELHDDLGQALSGLKLQLSSLDHRFADASLSDAADVRSRLGSMRQLIDAAMHTLRTVVTELRPEALDRLGLLAALEWQAETFSRHAGLRCRFNAAPDTIDLDMGRATSVFRIFQEMLTNIARHAGASRVDVTIEQQHDEFTLTVRDNGRGIAPGAAVSSRAFGLLGMRERALLLGGEIDLASVPRRGTTVSLRIPLANRRTAPRSDDNGGSL